eukprot:751899-Hanusia_phi.AAC.2
MGGAYPAVSSATRKTSQLLPLHLLEHPGMQIPRPVVHVFPGQRNSALLPSVTTRARRIGRDRRVREGRGRNGTGRERREGGREWV